MKGLKGIKFNQATLKRVPTVLRQPQWIAAIVSLGFHGVLFAAGPSFSSLQGFASTEGSLGDTERRVPLIELTPEEQSRLPDFSSSAYSLLPGDSGNLLDLFPPSGDSLGSLPLNPTPGAGGLSSLPDLSSSSSRSPFGSRIPSFPSSLGRRSVTNIPVTPGPATRPTRPSASGDNTTDDNQPKDESTSASTPTSGNPADTDEPRAADLEPRPGDGQPGDGDSAPLSASNGGNAEGGAEEEATQTAIARVEYSDELTTEAEVETAKTAWATAVAEELGEDPTVVEEVFSLEVPYDLRVCLSPEPTDGLLGFVVLPGEEADTLDLSTTVLKSTGYPFLNQAATQLLQTQAAESETPLEVGALYQAVVKVNYDAANCVNTDALLKSRSEATEAESESASGATSGTDAPTTGATPDANPAE